MLDWPPESGANDAISVVGPNAGWRFSQAANRACWDSSSSMREAVLTEQGSAPLKILPFEGRWQPERLTEGCHGLRTYAKIWGFSGTGDTPPSHAQEKGRTPPPLEGEDFQYAMTLSSQGMIFSVGDHSDGNLDHDFRARAS
jgi:hypothetical protein